MNKKLNKLLLVKGFLGFFLIISITSLIQCSNQKNLTQSGNESVEKSKEEKQVSNDINVEKNKEDNEENKDVLDSNNEVNNKNGKLVEKNKENINVNKKFSKDLLLYTYQGYDKRFQGALDYMHTLTCLKEEEEDDIKISKYKGEISNKSNKKSNFYIMQTVNKDSIIENIEYNDKSKENLSIIPNKITLKTPIDEGNTWSQKVDVNGKSYNVNSKINKIEKATNKNRKRIHVTHKINNISGYKDNTYTEKCIYEESLGLVFFEKNLPEDNELKKFHLKRSDEHIGYKYTE